MNDWQMEEHELALKIAVSKLTEHHLMTARAVSPQHHNSSDIYKKLINQVDRAIVSTSLKVLDCNQTVVSESLSINRGTLRAKMRDLGIRKSGEFL